MNFCFTLAALLCMSGSLVAQVRFLEPDRALIESRLKRAAVKNPDRKDALEALFRDAGCADGLTEQPVKGAKTPNVICIWPGESEEQIIIGAHYDKVPDGKGVIDNWSGASLLPTLLECLKGEKRKHTLIFIGFTDEEKGEVGSQYYVKQLSPAQISKIVAMVNMDTLALGPTEVWVSHADPKLTAAIAAVAQSMHIPLTGMNVEQVGSTDSEQFRAKKVPAITVHTLTTETLPILHTNKDDFDKVKMDDYFQSARLIAAYLAYLDGSLKTTAPVSSPSPAPVPTSFLPAPAKPPALQTWR